MKIIAAVLLGGASLGLGGCGIISGVAEAVRAPATWPPAHVQIDPQAIYITGTSDNHAEKGRAEAFANALEQGKKMGLKDFALSEVCQDQNYVDYNNVRMIRIFYRVVLLPQPQPVPPQ